MDAEEFRAHAHAFADWMADYLATVEQRPVRSQAAPGSILEQLPASCPETGEPMDAIFEDFKHVILPGITHWQHPRFFAYFNANASPPSILAEMLTATLAAQCMLWETSPAATELEVRVMEWLRDLIGLPEGFVGAIQDSGSASNLCALIAAREKASRGAASADGLAGAPAQTVYASQEAHSSVEKGAKIAGFGAAHVRKIAVGADGAMDVAALRAAIRADREHGLVPACIVASLGATGLGSVDPIAALAEVAAEEDVFLHVDAAWAGSAMILPEERHALAGIEGVDSFVFNPHKWLFTNFDCSAFFMKDPDTLARALAATPAYLESVFGDHAPEYRDWSVALGRRFRALKLWFVLRSYGAEGLRARLREHIRMCRDLAETIRAELDFDLVSEPRFALLAFRWRPSWAADADLDRLNEALLRRVNDDGVTYLTKTRARGRVVIRVVTGQTNTEDRHVAEAWAAVKAAAGAVAEGERPDD